ncbi:hypothetical protein N4684_12160, partial [Escherichia coli]|nr:hypothetical protein [Escherichia coli]MCU6961651.1 hypothetical protein [Escherichia coli]
MKTCITKGIVTVSLTAILLSCSSAWAAGKGGIGLAATRLVYSEGEEQISLGVRNTSPDVPGNDSNLLIVFYVQIMPDDFVMQLHR